MNIYLIGYRATGKSTVARLLAERLGPPWRFFDVDRRIVEKAGMPIDEIFAAKGEPHFRDLEAEIVAEAEGQDQLVVATGGGTCMRPANRERIVRGFVVWLRAKPDTILRRTIADPVSASHRPALTLLGPLEEIEHLLNVRGPVYAELERFTLDVDELGIEQIVEHLHTVVVK